MTATQQQDVQLQRRLQQDSIQLGGRTIYLNPFLYWRRFDSNTDRWLREPGQLTEDQITANRSRFYPELDWGQLDDHATAVHDGAVEMFLKSLELISTFHPELGSGQMLEVERKMTITKKRPSSVGWTRRSGGVSATKPVSTAALSAAASGVPGGSGSCWTPPRKPWCLW